MRSYTHPDLRDNPVRIGDPDFGPETPDFNALPMSQRLDSVQSAIKQTTYKLALIEALPESDEYASWLNQLADSAVSDAVIGHVAREIVCAHIAAVARQHAEEI
jgi:hypothetical protein